MYLWGRDDREKVMWPFKEKDMPKPASYKSPPPEVIHAKCRKCGKTDFKDNMVKRHGIKYKPFTGVCTVEGECIPNKDAPYIDTYYKHKRCLKEKK